MIYNTIGGHTQWVWEGGKAEQWGQILGRFHHPMISAEIQKQRRSFHPLEGEKFILFSKATKHDIAEIWVRTAVKFSMTGCILMAVSHFESVMDHWINATALLNDLNILSNYDFTILLYKLKVQCSSTMWALSLSTFPQDHGLGEGKDISCLLRVCKYCNSTIPVSYD